MAYATPADLASFLQVSSVDTASATLILQLVSDEIDAYIGQSLDQATVTALLLDGPAAGSAQLVLPGFPVSAVALIEVQEADGAWTPLADGVDYHWSTSGVVNRIFSSFDPNDPVQPAWPVWAKSIRVSYTRGDSAALGAVKGVCLSASARMFINPAGLQSEQIGGMSLRYGAKSGAVELSALEQRILDRLTDHVLA
jgi:hypothetical protein